MIPVSRSATFEAPTTAANARRDFRTSPQNVNDSFAQQIAAALEGYLSGGTGPSKFEIDIDTQPGQDSGTRQILVTIKNATPATAPPQVASRSGSTRTVPEPTPSAPPAAVYQSMMVNGIVNQYTPPAPASDEPVIQTAADAYWALQPKEVQALRAIPNESDRQAKATELAGKGFAIDTEIMIFGYDPYLTMKHREGSGYTWIPAAGQPNIPLGPGLSFPGLPSYDPARPPAGSIPVSTAFAKGLEHTIPFLGFTFKSTS